MTEYMQLAQLTRMVLIALCSILVSLATIQYKTKSVILRKFTKGILLLSAMMVIMSSSVGLEI